MKSYHGCSPTLTCNAAFLQYSFSTCPRADNRDLILTLPRTCHPVPTVFIKADSSFPVPSCERPPLFVRTTAKYGCAGVPETDARPWAPTCCFGSGYHNLAASLRMCSPASIIELIKFSVLDLRCIRCLTLFGSVARGQPHSLLSIQRASHSHGVSGPRLSRCEAVEAKPNPGTNGYSFRDALCFGKLWKKFGSNTDDPGHGESISALI